MTTSDGTTNTYAEDLQYVRNVVQRRRIDATGVWVALVWAFVNLIGLSLYDFSLFAGGIFWMIALPLFGIGTWVAAAYAGKKLGEEDRELGRRNALHWTSIPLFLVLANVLYASTPMDFVATGQVALLVIGLVYYLGGVHFWWGYLPGGIAVASGVVWLAVLDSYPWTVTGVLTFLALSISGLVDWRRHAATA